MAGTNSGFDAAAFRTAIRSAMTMGSPSATGLQATFRWSEQKTFSTADKNGKPYSWTSTPTTDVTHPDVQVPVAVKFVDEGAVRRTQVGDFARTRAEITILDDDFTQIIGADVVLLGGAVYDIISEPMPEGLFDVTVYRIWAQARSKG